MSGKVQPRYTSHARDHRGSGREYHIVVLGAGGVGKSCLTEHYDPTIEDTYRKQIEVDGRQCVLEILDTAGTEQFAAMRELYMKTGQGFLLVFSITSLNSLMELSELRDQIIRIKDDEKTPLVIVGNKSDLEEDRAVSRARAFAVSQSWGNAPYYETSARRRANVDEVFVDLCRQIIRKDASAAPSRGDHKRHTTTNKHLGGGSSAPSTAAREVRHSHHRSRGRRRRQERICTIL
ncbi:MAG: Ras- protein rsr1 [Peltula sp. TS41687]|nr:MAG: Ras- protein rsr1 [Peltula sp. TS41687]